MSAVLVVGGGTSAWRWADAARTSAASPVTTPPAPAPASVPTAALAGTAAAPVTGAAPARAVQPVAPGVPVSVEIAAPSTHHRHGVRATVTGHRLNADGSLFVPADPRAVAWSSEDAAPGSAQGTAILVSHVNYVIDGRTVPGAFADLAEYAHNAIGRLVLVRLTDGRTLRYRITRGVEYAKAELADHPELRRTLFDQSSRFGRGTGRLLLVSCGGDFDPVSGEYDDNVFLYALPVG